MTRVLRPGSHLGVWTEEYGNGVGIVLATSRHSEVLDRREAARKLAAEATTTYMGRDVDPTPLVRVIEATRSWRWRSVTKREVEDGSHYCWLEETDHRPGDWCSEGQGQAWMDVLTIGSGQVYDLLDVPDDEEVIPVPD